MSQSVPLWMMIAGFLLVLGPLVTLHELGHYLVGRLFGVKADAFSVGFGKELAGFTDRRGTRWKLSALPLGGYVQFAGDMNPASTPTDEWLALPERERARTFQAKTVWQRALIVFAGPATNILITLAIFAGFAMAYGKVTASDEVGGFAERSPARAAGVEVGDRILAVDGDAIDGFQGLQRRVVLYPGRTVTLTVGRDGQEMAIPVTLASSVERDQFGNESRIGRLGVASRPGAFSREDVGPGGAIALAFRQTGELFELMVAGIGQIIGGERSVEELGGPLSIGKFSGEQLSLGPQAFVNFAALISINLAFINLLPIPALDGGHLAFYAAEAVRRKPVGPQVTEWAYRTGIAMVLALMLFVTVNDVVKLRIFGG